MKSYKGSDRIFNVVIVVIISVIAIITLFPLIHVLACSFSSVSSVNSGSVGLIPSHFTISGYLKVFNNQAIIRGFSNTLIYTTVGTIIQIVLQFTCAYPLSRKDFKARNVISLLLVFTMFVSGGMIPTYLVVNSLNMVNTPWAMIIPGCVNVFNIIIIRTYMTHTIPSEIQDAAVIDGCGDFGLFLRIIIPLCKPILMVMILYSVVGYWNSYFNSLLYLTDDSLFPLQRVLQNLLVNNDNSSIGSGEAGMLSEQLKYVTIVVSSLPLLIIYPFFQKHFEKGVMIGGIKG